MTTVTVIRNADWVVAWDRNASRHVYLRGIDVAFEGNEIRHVGPRYSGPADVEVDGRERLVLPGLINVHAHPSSEPLRKGITDETRSPGFHHSSLYEFLTVFDTDAEARVACLQVALAELLLSGCTTVVDLSFPYAEWLDALGDSGIRAVVAPGFRDARWLTRDGHSLEYEWDANAGRNGMERAMRIIDLAAQHPSGRLSGMVYPTQVDTCTSERLRDAHAWAQERRLPFQIHAAVELDAQFEELGIDPDHLYVAGANMTPAGLALGFRALGRKTRVVGITPIRWKEDRRTDIARIANATAQLLKLDARLSPADVINYDDYIGARYGVVTPAGRDALRLAAVTEGLVLDPVYTSKALAGLIDHVRTGKIGEDEVVVFVHTGGNPAVFAYAEDLLAR